MLAKTIVSGKYLINTIKVYSIEECLFVSLVLLTVYLVGLIFPPLQVVFVFLQSFRKRTTELFCLQKSCKLVSRSHKGALIKTLFVRCDTALKGSGKYGNGKSKMFLIIILNKQPLQIYRVGHPPYQFWLFTNYASQCQGKGRDKQGQTWTRQGQAETRQGRTGARQGLTGTNRECTSWSLLIPVCPCLSLSVPVCPCLSLSVPVCTCLSLSGSTFSIPAFLPFQMNITVLTRPSKSKLFCATNISVQKFCAN